VAAIPADSSAEEDWLEPDLSKMELKDGYGQSKVAAEQLLSAARRQLGLDVRVVRPSAVCGDTRTGYSNQLDFGGLLLKACALIQGAVLETPAVLHWIPVDVVARVTVALARHPKASGRVFHLTSSGPLLRDVLKSMQEAGCSIVNMPKQLWRTKLLALPQSERAIYPLRDMLSNFDWLAAPSAAVSTTQTREFLSTELGITLSSEGVSADQLAKMVKYLKEQQFF
jgi:thioester reductase-like protein